MSKMYEEVHPAASSDLDDLDFQAEDDWEIQRHEADIDEPCIEMSPVFERRASSAEDIQSPKKLMFNKNVLQLQSAEPDDDVFLADVTPETLWEQQSTLPKCPMKVYHNRKKSTREWKKLQVNEAAIALPTSLLPRGKKRPLVESAEKQKLIKQDLETVVDSDAHIKSTVDMMQEVSTELPIVLPKGSPLVSVRDPSLTLKESSSPLMILYQKSNRTPKENMLLDSSSKLGDNITLSDASPQLWGSSISGISPLSQSSIVTDAYHANEDSKDGPLPDGAKSTENMISMTTQIFTSTPLSSSGNFYWEELSSVTDDPSSSSLLIPARKSCGPVNSSELQFSSSQESNKDDDDNLIVQNHGCSSVSSSQEPSGSDKENVDPNYSENSPKVKRIKVEMGLDCDYTDFLHSNSRTHLNSASEFNSA